jgi:hypothetical protein
MRDSSRCQQEENDGGVVERSLEYEPEELDGWIRRIGLGGSVEGGP